MYSRAGKGKKENKASLNTALFVSGSKAGWGFGRDRVRARTNKSKLDSRSQNEGFLSQANLTCNHCQTPGHIRPNSPELQRFRCRAWGNQADSPSEVAKDKPKEESAVMAVNIESKVAPECELAS